MVGQTLGHYRIDALLGEGGMGSVYRAHDTRLQRTVAIKILRGEPDEVGRDRTLREARAASALNHVNVCTIHEVGEVGEQTFIVMEFVEGKPLSQITSHAPLSVESIIHYGIQVADALAHAHDKGIVHRDLKSANVVISREGTTKVLDFGIAVRWHEPEMAAVTRSARPLTEEGAIAGTLPYMAPEALSGEPPSPANDIWALGVLLYEMASGELPFKGQTGIQLTAAILQQPPPALPSHIPSALRALIHRCLAKEPTLRSRRATDVRAVLEAVRSEPDGVAGSLVAKPRRARYGLDRWARAGLAILALLVLAAVGTRLDFWRTLTTGRTPAQRIQSLAVLPLKNLSNDPEQEYFTDGMTDAMISNLNRIRGVRVTSLTSVMRYKNARQALPDIGAALNVDAIVEGTVLRSGDRVRISAQLVRVRGETSVWSQSYERDLRDVLTLQREIAQTIAREVSATLVQEGTAQAPTARAIIPAAYEAYLKGRDHWNRRTKNDFTRAVEYFRESASLDSTYAPARAGLADVYVLLGFYAYMIPRDAYRLAREAAQQALRIDPNLAEAYATLGFVALYYDWDLKQAERDFVKAIDLNPNYATAHQWFATVFEVRGNFDRAIAERQQALIIDPLSPATNAYVARAFYLAADYPHAIEYSQKALQLEPSSLPGLLWLGLSYAQSRNGASAISVLTRAVESSSGNARAHAALAYAYAVSGDRTAATRILGELIGRREREYVSAFDIASVYAALRDKDLAFQWLETALGEHVDELIHLDQDPRFQPIRDEPRFAVIVRRLGL